ncbi:MULTISPECIES: hypothetical protein [unclassified Arthrobacter]|uniref:hypothetical protein n=1 Tax=unclassified Arthrobacter TaxID=235627 RepID=UPI001D13EDCE|nr:MULTISPECIES: hypothetical protein [unclassified Arthrobacter]MCC3289878.1 hypothetical protein [Arthrobacter sp. zg-Y1110]MCC3300609.1 hypothetical protein [Arthrobacter sp. zg-Y895]MCQ1945997.1 hypothetical protein [Arthrobacter sp. zg-Y1116]UWX84714.1 hypothetical protein N2K99_14810 [Arthrobacter sp. zg-Y1110]
MNNFKQSAALISWGGAILFLGALFILFSAMDVLMSSGAYSDTHNSVMFLYLGVVVAIAGVSMLLVGIHRVVSSLGVPGNPAVQDQPVPNEPANLA